MKSKVVCLFNTFYDQLSNSGEWIMLRYQGECSTDTSQSTSPAISLIQIFLSVSLHSHHQFEDTVKLLGLTECTFRKNDCQE